MVVDHSLATCFSMESRPVPGPAFRIIFQQDRRSFLHYIRVDKKQELVERIYRRIDEINKDPVVFRWRNKMEEIATASV